MKLPTFELEMGERVISRSEATALAGRNQQALDAIFDALEQLQKSGVNIGSKAKAELLERQRIRMQVRKKSKV